MQRFRPWSSDGDPVAATERARRLERQLNAFVAFRDGELRAHGPLNGLSYAAKDIFSAPDRRPCGGLAHALPPTDCAYADALRLLDQAGAHRIGYTALTEIAYEPSGYNAVHGWVANPWNPEFIPGGSSSGSAAAVASGAVTVALGSDTGGSLRIPAHACGITGWKPTHGAVSTRGTMPLAPTLDTIGLLGRSAADMLPAFDRLAPHLSRTTPVRNAVVITDALKSAQPSVFNACRDGIDGVAATGIGVDQRDGLAFIDAIDASVFTIMQGEAARHHRHLLDGDAIDPVLRRRLAKGLDIDDTMLAAAVARRPSLADEFAGRLLQSADVAILPVMTVRTPPTAECDPDGTEFRPRTLYELSRLTRFVNMLGFPAVAFPVGFDDRGMPVGLQVVGKPNSDRALLELTADVQSRTDWHGRVPDAVSSTVLEANPSDVINREGAA